MNEKNTKVEEKNLRRKVKNKSKNKGKHNKKVLKVVIYITLVLFVLSLLFLLGYGAYSLCTSSKYNLKTIVFEGNNHYDNLTLMDSISINEGINIYKISKKQLVKELEVLPYIDDIKISKKYPDTLIIKIVEHTSAFLAYNDETNKYVKLTEAGTILEVCDSNKKESNELILFGINFDDNLKEEIEPVEKNKLVNYSLIKEHYEKAEINMDITSVEFKEGDIILTLNQDINVIMNTDDIIYKMSFLKSILNEIVNKAGTIDMRVDNPIFSEIIK